MLKRFFCVYDWNPYHPCIKYWDLGGWTGINHKETSIAHQIKNPLSKNEWAYYDYIFSNLYTSIAHRIKDPLRRTSDHIAIKYFQNLYITHNSYDPWVNCERSFCALREDAFGTLASLHWQSFVSTLWFNFCSQIIMVKQDFNSMLHKVLSVKEISCTYLYL